MVELERTIFVLRRWWWLLLGAAIVGGAVAYLLTKSLSHPVYESTAIVSFAPEEGVSGLLTPSADAQLVPTLAKSTAVQRQIPGVSASQLSSDVQGSASPEGELLNISVRYSDPTLAPTIANAVARTFISQERARLKQRYAIIHAGYQGQERHLTDLMRASTGSGPARSWLESQYADSIAKLYQSDTQYQIQAATQVRALQLAQPASAAVWLGTKASLNAALGAALALLVALVFAFIATGSYGDAADASVRRPVLSKVGD